MARLPLRAPRDYDQGAFGRILTRIERELGARDNAIAKLQSRLEAVLDPADETDDPSISGYVVWEQYDAGNVYRARVYIVSGRRNIIAAEYRVNSGGAIADTDTWSDMTLIGSDDEHEAIYEATTPITLKAGNESIAQAMQVRVRNEFGTSINETHLFDIDHLPNFRHVNVRVGWHSGSTYSIIMDYVLDEDATSVEWYASTTDYPSTPLGDGDYTNFNNSSNVSGVNIGNVTPSPVGGPVTKYYVDIRARSLNDQAGEKGNPVRFELEIPADPTDPSVFPAGSIAANQLVDAMQRASFNFNVQWYATDPDAGVTVTSGSIRYSDGTSYSISPAQNLFDAATTNTHYIYFDPAIENDQLQDTTNASEAFTITGKRVFVGVYKPTNNSGERAMYVFGDDEYVVSAPFIYALSLSALSANMGTLTAGEIVIGSTNKIWLNDSDDGGLHIGGSSKGSAPFSVAADGSITIGSGSNTLTYDVGTTTLSIQGGGLITVDGAKFGADAYTSGWDGLYLNSANFWSLQHATGEVIWKMGDGTSYVIFETLSGDANMHFASATGDYVNIGTDALGSGLSGMSIYDGTRSRLKVGEISSDVYGMQVWDAFGAKVLDTSVGVGVLGGSEGMDVAGTLRLSGEESGDLDLYEKVATISDITGTPKTVTSLTYSGADAIVLSGAKVYVKNVEGFWEEFTLTGSITSSSGTVSVSSRTLNYDIDNGASPNNLYRIGVSLSSGGVFIASQDGGLGLQLSINGNIFRSSYTDAAGSTDFDAIIYSTAGATFQTYSDDLVIGAGSWALSPAVDLTLYAKGDVFIDAGSGYNVIIEGQEWPSSVGTDGNFLQTNSSGILSWAFPTISAKNLTDVTDIQTDWYWSSTTLNTDPEFWIDASAGAIHLQSADAESGVTTRNSPILYLQGEYWATASYTLTSQIYTDVTGSNTGDLVLQINKFGGGGASLRIGSEDTLQFNTDDVLVTTGYTAGSTTESGYLTVAFGGNSYRISVEAV